EGGPLEGELLEEGGDRRVRPVAAPLRARPGRWGRFGDRRGLLGAEGGPLRRDLVVRRVGVLLVLLVLVLVRDLGGGGGPRRGLCRDRRGPLGAGLGRAAPRAGGERRRGAGDRARPPGLAERAADEGPADREGEGRGDADR